LQITTQKFRRELKFEQVVKSFKIIDDSYQFSAFVPWGDGKNILNSLDLSKPLSESDWRKLQPYTLNLPKKWEPTAEKHLCGLITWPILFCNDNFGASETMQNFVVGSI
jgi:hypothetical protein